MESSRQMFGSANATAARYFGDDLEAAGHPHRATNRTAHLFVGSFTALLWFCCQGTIAILRGLKERYEAHHGVRILDSALVAAAVNSHKYMSERRLPDKAIDLVDEAAAQLRLQQESKPEVMEKLVLEGKEG